MNPDKKFVELVEYWKTNSGCVEQDAAVAVRGDSIVAMGVRRPLTFFSCDRSCDDDCCLSCHAVQMLFVDAANRGVKLSGTEIFVYYLPCSSCGKMLVEAGVQRIVYLKWKPDSVTSSMARRSLIPMCQYKNEDKHKTFNVKIKDSYLNVGKVQEIFVDDHEMSAVDLEDCDED